MITASALSSRHVFAESRVCTCILLLIVQFVLHSSPSTSSFSDSRKTAKGLVLADVVRCFVRELLAFFLVLFLPVGSCVAILSDKSFVTAEWSKRYDCKSLDETRGSSSTLRPGSKNKESSYLPEGDLQQITIILLGTQRKWKSYRTVFKWPSKNQYQNYYSGQSQQGQTTWWTNLNS